MSIGRTISSMVLVNCMAGEKECYAFLIGEQLYPLHECNPNLPKDAALFMSDQKKFLRLARLMDHSLKTGAIRRPITFLHKNQVQQLKEVAYETI